VPRSGTKKEYSTMDLTRPAALLRAEGAVLLVGALWSYRGADGGWLPLALLLMVPDLSMLGYLAGPRVGAGISNAAHVALLVGLLWLAHMGLDRSLGYGLKEPTGLTDTHLRHGGRERHRQTQAASWTLGTLIDSTPC
jgi:hypothetical protein